MVGGGRSAGQRDGQGEREGGNADQVSGRGKQPMSRAYDEAVDLSPEPVNSDVKSQTSSAKGEANPRPYNYANYLRFPVGLRRGNPPKVADYTRRDCAEMSK